MIVHKNWAGFTGLIVAALFSLLLFSCTKKTETLKRGAPPLRIISFAPSITETLFALSLQDRIVGVTRFCNYPKEAQRIPRVGGYTDPNFEMLLGLKPDLVLMLREHGPLSQFLSRNSIKYLMVQNESLDQIIASFGAIGAACGRKKQGDSIAQAMRQELTKKYATEGAKKPRVLFCVGRDNPGSGHLGTIYVAGPNTFYHELIVASGGRNAYTDSTVSYPTLSAEGIARLSPDIIIDIMPSVMPLSIEKTLEDWQELSLLPAVRHHHLYCLEQDYVTIPGPRIMLLQRDLRTIIAAYDSSGTRGR